MTVHTVAPQEFRRLVGLSSDAKPATDIKPGEEFWESDTDQIYRWSGSAWERLRDEGAPFAPSAYAADLTMDATGEAVALATGARKVRIVNRGVTTEAIRVVFGTSEANALANLTIVTNAATTGAWIGAAADGFNPELVLGVPASATHIAIGPAVAGDTQSVNVTQGV